MPPLSRLGSNAGARERRFWDRIAEKYARTPLADKDAYRQKLMLTRGYLQPGDRVLEFGCGTGSTALEHAPFVASIEATDLSPKMLHIARAKAADAGVTNVTFTEAGVEDFEAAPESYDAVLALSLLHLLGDRQAALAKIHTLLKPGGVFVSNTACLADFMGWFRWVAPLGRAVGLVPLVKIFGADALRREVRAAGFEIVEEFQQSKDKALFLIARKPA